MILTSDNDIITSEDIPPLHDIESSDDTTEESPEIYTQDFDDAVSEFEKNMLTKAYERYRSSYKVAEALGMTQTKASRLLRKYGISSPKRKR